MRTIRENDFYRRSELKDALPGVCRMCGGEGRYRVTYKHKAPIIHHCLYCSGTGKVKITFTDREGEDLPGGMYLVSENEDSYIASDGRGQLTQLSKEYVLIKRRG